MHCNVKTRCEALKALAQKKLGTDDPAVVEITRGGKNRSHHVLRRSDMKKVGLIAGGAFVALTALNVYSHYKLHQKIADRKLKKQLAPLNAQLDELRLVVGKAAARAAQREGRTQHHRIADPLGGGDALLHVVGDMRRQHRFAQPLAQLLEQLAVFGLLDALERRTQNLDLALLQHALLGQLHGQI